MAGTQNSKQGRRKKALGRGLSALIPSQPAGGRAGSGDDAQDFFECEVGLIDPSPGQPRRTFDEEALEELSASIVQSGLIQPLVVRRVEERYELIAGERRLRASKMAGLARVPVVVKDVSDAVAFALALIENIQREDLDPVEEALAYKRLIDDFDFTQAELARQLGKSRSTIANAIRLLALPERVLDMVGEEDLSPGHARTLVGLESEDMAHEVAERVRREGLTVRETEAITRELKAAAKARDEAPEPADEPAEGEAPAAQEAPDAAPAPGPEPVATVAERVERASAKAVARDDDATRALVDALTSRLETRVVLHDRNGEGKLEIHYGSYGELEVVLAALGVDAEL
jgi:ParB family chromosome partitioning protein